MDASLTGLLPASLGKPCPCDRDGEHTPVLVLPLPLSVTAMVKLTTALDKALAESKRHGIMITDGRHETNVVYAVPDDA